MCYYIDRNTIALMFIEVGRIRLLLCTHYIIV